MTKDTMQSNANGLTGPDANGQSEEAKSEEAGGQSPQSLPDSEAQPLKSASPPRMPLLRR